MLLFSQLLSCSESLWFSKKTCYVGLYMVYNLCVCLKMHKRKPKFTSCTDFVSEHKGLATSGRLANRLSCWFQMNCFAVVCGWSQLHICHAYCPIQTCFGGKIVVVQGM